MVAILVQGTVETLSVLFCFLHSVVLCIMCVCVFEYATHISFVVQICTYSSDVFFFFFGAKGFEQRECDEWYVYCSDQIERCRRKGKTHIRLNSSSGGSPQ